MELYYEQLDEEKDKMDDIIAEEKKTELGKLDDNNQANLFRFKEKFTEVLDELRNVVVAGRRKNNHRIMLPSMIKRYLAAADTHNNWGCDFVSGIFRQSS